MDEGTKRRIRRDLIQAAHELSTRCLYNASKWASELAYGMGPFDDSSAETVTSVQTFNEEHIKYQIAKSHFEMREYFMCVDRLKGCGSQQSLFLRAYATFMISEKRKEEEEASETPDKSAAGKDHDMQALRLELQALHVAGQLDGYGLYIYGITLRELRMTSWARTILTDAVNVNPYNWSAWLDLASVCLDVETVRTLKLNEHLMRDFFMAHVMLELQQTGDSLSIYETFKNVFPTSNYILAQTAIANYNVREYDVGERLFEILQAKDPHRLENMDVYSNILYVKDSKAKLSSLAHMAAATEKYCPESCCIIGNYYSLKLEHEKAVIYFKRALKLNRKYLSAWTLMGHEYVELKNTAAAIEAYRKAVEINPRDYRAWYGLGNTYQILKMPLYAMFYFRKATTLRPYDARMWLALGGCYEALERSEDAIKCYERTESCTDNEASYAVNRLAKLHSDLGNDDRAAYYYKKNLDRRDAEQVEGPDTIDALYNLATHCKNIGRLDEAEKYATRLLDYSGKTQDEAKALLHEIHNVLKK